MCIEGERIDGKQDRPNLISPQIAKNIQNWFSNCFPLLYICLHCDEVCICRHFGDPGLYVRAEQDPEKYKIYFIFLNIFYFK